MQTDSELLVARPEVAVLMATHNGLPWLAEQMDSILTQSDVQVRLYVSDDASNDGTLTWLKRLAERDTRVLLLPQGRNFGSAGKNFYRLIIDADISGCDYVAFADQDDVWLADKLIRQVRLLKQHGADGVSSDVTAFWPDGSRTSIIKSQPQRKFDYLFESAGPGCTFLMSQWLIGELKKLLNNPGPAKDVTLHDWLAYAVCRASGRKWVIDSTPTVQYRQHGANVLGANHGWRAKMSRVKKMTTGWYRGEVIKVSQVCMTVSVDPSLATISGLISAPDVSSRLHLLACANQARRRFLDRLFLAISILFFLF